MLHENFIGSDLDHYDPNNHGTNQSYHGKGGPITTSYSNLVDNIAESFVTAAMNYGIDYNDDFNDPNKRLGVGYYHFNIAPDGTRDGAARQLLRTIVGENCNMMFFINEVIPSHHCMYRRTKSSSPLFSSQVIEHEGIFIYNLMQLLLEFLSNRLIMAGQVVMVITVHR
jgi:choline dehydrogenase-like flavoprotein